jgi:hypothetical protein
MEHCSLKNNGGKVPVSLHQAYTVIQNSPQFGPLSKQIQMYQSLLIKLKLIRPKQISEKQMLSVLSIHSCMNTGRTGKEMVVINVVINKQCTVQKHQMFILHNPQVY